MKKVLFTLIAIISLTFTTQTGFAAPMPPGGGHGAPMHRPYRPIIRPYYSPFYYSSVYYPRYTTYSYYYPTEYERVVITPATVGTVVVCDDYAGVNTAANVINAAANVAATIRYLTW